MPTPTLGNFDMVMAISQNIINNNFKNSNIKTDINFIVSQIVSPKGVPKYSVNAPINQDELNSWIKKADNSFYYALEGMIDDPQITIEKDTPKSLHLTITFVSGNFYFQKVQSKKVTTIPMTQIVYTINVDLSLITIDNTDDISSSSAKNTINDIINNSGLPGSDFDTLGLFLDFTKLSNESYVPSKSNVPESAVGVFNLAMQQYFTKLFKPGQSNLALGYSPIQKSNVTHALFQPTSASFSTSYSSKGKKFNSLNFLFMLNGNPIPTGSKDGILPTNLIEEISSIVTSPIPYGTFGVDYSEVLKLIITPLQQSVISSLITAFNKSNINVSGYDAQSSSTRTDNKTDFTTIDRQKQIVTGKKGFLSFLIGRELQIESNVVQGSITTKNNNQSTQGLILNFTYNFSITITTQTLLAGAQSATLSSSGREQKGPNNNLGQQGEMLLYIFPGSSGSLNIQIHSQQDMQLGYENIISSDTIGSKIFANLEAEVNPQQLFGKTFTSTANDLKNGVSNAISKLQGVITTFKSPKVVLPLANDYEFKNFLLNKSDGNVVLSKASYLEIQ